ncbi:MAG: hypothetical protein IJ738_05160 [Alphaproteobacteria bacterium]|nr:hypothetical protein [Alphaproteobacteria bacterium]
MKKYPLLRAGIFLFFNTKIISYTQCYMPLSLQYFFRQKYFKKNIHNYIVFLMATNLSTLLLSYHINYKNSGRKQKVSKQGTAADKLFVVLAFLI